MTCQQRYAEAWEYGAFFCVGSLLAGNHGGAGPADAALSDVNGDFVTNGLRPLEGQVLYNLTQNTDGLIIGVTDTTLTAVGVTWNALDEYRVSTMKAAELLAAEHYLNITGADISMALNSVEACDCTWWDEFDEWAKKINIIEAAALHVCPCASPHISEKQIASMLQWAEKQLDRVRKLEFDPCKGYPGSAFPATGWASQGSTDFAIADIIYKDILRNE